MMTTRPVICFGQQPCGFFPKRFLAAKIQTARRLQAQEGGDIVFFYHDSDHDPRETKTLLRHRQTRELAQLNFTFENRLQRKFSPLFLKRVPTGWQNRTALQLPNYVERGCLEVFARAAGANAADFCLDMYQRMGLLDGIRVARSSDSGFRRAACDVNDFFIDIPHEGEIVRARYSGGELKLHEGGHSFITLPASPFGKEQISPTRDTRLRWMQSVLHCTHYIAGHGEVAYLRQEEVPEITFVNRDTIERPDEAYTEIHS
jgi:hypothetical protein